MSKIPFQAIGHDIFCIDSGLCRHGFAACYLIREGDRLALVDTGTARSVPRVLEVIAALGLQQEHVDYVIPTHVHLDHAGGAGELIACCPNARLVIHPKGESHMVDPSKLEGGATAVYGQEAFERDFGRLVPVPETRVTVAGDGVSVDLNGRNLVFIYTPGHANHHGCIYDERSSGFFTGDTFGISYREFDTVAGPLLFAPTTPVAFDPDVWQSSLDRLMAYQPRAAYLTHYGKLERPERMVMSLRQSIRDLAGLALAEEDQPGPERIQRLQVAVQKHLTNQVQKHGCDLDATRIHELLTVDVELNAQGLEVWLIRRAKKAVSSEATLASGGPT